MLHNAHMFISGYHFSVEHLCTIVVQDTAICWRHHSYVFTVLVSNGSTFLTVKEKFRYYEAKIEESKKPAVIRKPLSMSSLLMERIFQSTPLTAHAEWLPGVQLRHFSPTCAVHIEDCGGWWLSGCRSSVAEHWLHKPGVLSSIPGDCRPFTLLYFHLGTSKFPT